MKTINLSELARNPDIVPDDQHDVMIAFTNAVENMSDSLLLEFMNTQKLLEQTPDLYTGCVVTSSYNQKVLVMPYDEFFTIVAYELCLRGFGGKKNDTEDFF